MLKTIRRILAVCSIIAATLIFIDVSGLLHAWLGWIAKLQLLPAILALNVVVVLALVVLTLLFGRIYCSVICPLGILQDIFSRFGQRMQRLFTGRRARYAYVPARNLLRYAFLLLFCLLILAGFTSLAGMFEPYSAFGRMATYLLAPVYAWGNNILALAAERADSYAFYSVEVWSAGAASLAVAIVTLVVIFLFSSTSGRTYCNTICPVGTLLGFFSRFSRLKVVIQSDRCSNCGRCAAACKAQCIDFKHHTVDYSRCVVCGNCIGKCSMQAIAYGHKPTIDRESNLTKMATQRHDAPKGTVKANDASTDSVATAEQAQTETSRRAFLLTTAAVTAGAALAQAEKKVDGGLAAIADKQIPQRKGRLVPQGAQSERHFYQHCTACQLCVTSCPNGVLRPSTDLDHFMQPVMQFERGYCRPECNVCSEVCPTGAIRLVDLAQKSSVKIGTARVILDNCVTTAGTRCGNCARHCPTGAITMVDLRRAATPTEGDRLPVETFPSPVVDPECCIGCGACENLCPVRPISAIIVDAIEQHRNI